jgi:hypothetical protein
MQFVTFVDLIGTVVLPIAICLTFDPAPALREQDPERVGNDRATPRLRAEHHFAVRELCGTFCFSMQFVTFVDLIGTVVLPIAICLTYALIRSAIR